MLGRLLLRASRDRGRFRTFLLNALDNFVLSEIRRQNTQRRRPAGGHVSFEGIERDGGLAEVTDSEGAIIVNAGAKVPVKIRDWLPLACQFAGFEPSSQFDQDTWAVYQNNLATALFLPSVSFLSLGMPPGPATFVGKILVTQSFRDKCEGTFKWIVAHELVHSFDALRFLVPATMNWKSFWPRLLGGGSFTGRAMETFGWQAEFLDREYRSPNELVLVKEYWPSQAGQWFRACVSDSQA